MAGGVQVVTGTVEFIWESDDGLLVNLEPDDPAAPHTFEIAVALRDRLGGSLTEGDRVEVEFTAVEHEVVDPDSGPSQTLRAHVHDLRVVG